MKRIKEYISSLGIRMKGVTLINGLDKREKWAYGLIVAGVVCSLFSMCLEYLLETEMNIFYNGQLVGALFVIVGIAGCFFEYEKEEITE